MLYALSGVEILSLDECGNLRSISSALSEGNEPAFTSGISDVVFRGNVNLVNGASGLEARPGTRVVVWSGTLADAWDSRDPATWGPSGLERLRAAVAQLGPAATDGGYEVLLRPHARHVLCDVQRTLKLLHEWREWPIGLALDAAALVEVSMLVEADDHLRRAYETLGPLARVVFVADVSEPADDGAPVRAVPLGEGLVGADRIVELVESNVGPGVPRIVLSEADARRIAGGWTAR